MLTATRRPAAILAADVAGYSRLMGADEEGTLERLKALRRRNPARDDRREPELLDERRIRFRIGINLGDVIADYDDIFGDGVKTEELARREANIGNQRSVYRFALAI